MLIESDDAEAGMILRVLKGKLRNVLNRLSARTDVPFDCGKIIGSKFRRLVLCKFEQRKESTANSEIKIDENTKYIKCFNLHYSDLVHILGRKAVRKSVGRRRQWRIINARWTYGKESNNWNWTVSVGLYVKQDDGTWQLIANRVSR